MSDIDVEALARKLWWTAHEMKRPYREAGFVMARLYCAEVDLDADAIERQVVEDRIAEAREAEVLDGIFGDGLGIYDPRYEASPQPAPTTGVTGPGGTVGEWSIDTDNEGRRHLHRIDLSPCLRCRRAAHIDADSGWCQECLSSPTPPPRVVDVLSSSERDRVWRDRHGNEWRWHPGSGTWAYGDEHWRTQPPPPSDGPFVEVVEQQ